MAMWKAGATMNSHYAADALASRRRLTVIKRVLARNAVLLAERDALKARVAELEQGEAWEVTLELLDMVDSLLDMVDECEPVWNSTAEQKQIILARFTEIAAQVAAQLAAAGGGVE